MSQLVLRGICREDLHPFPGRELFLEKTRQALPEFVLKQGSHVIDRYPCEVTFYARALKDKESWSKLSLMDTNKITFKFVGNAKEEITRPVTVRNKG